MYVLDEPSIGLHQRDNDRLLQTLEFLRDLGNTVIVVEHDEDAIRRADHVIDIGPGAGVHGGQVVAEGPPAKVIKNKKSLTGQYLSGTRHIAIPERIKPGKNWLSIKRATGNNLKQVDIKLPLGVCTVVTGVSGSGKSTLINDTLYRHAANVINKSRHKVAPVKSIEHLEVTLRPTPGCSPRFAIFSPEPMKPVRVVTRRGDSVSMLKVAVANPVRAMA